MHIDDADITTVETTETSYDFTDMITGTASDFRFYVTAIEDTNGITSTEAMSDVLYNEWALLVLDVDDNEVDVLTACCAYPMTSMSLPSYDEAWGVPEGKAFDHWEYEVQGTAYTGLPNDVLAFDGEYEVILHPVFSTVYNITVNNGLVAQIYDGNGFVDTTSAAAGQSVSIYYSDEKIPKGKYIKDIISDDVELDVFYDTDGVAYGAGFIMPDKDVTINAVLADAEPLYIDLTSGSAKASWIVPMYLGDCYVESDDSFDYFDLDGDGSIDIKLDYSESQDAQAADVKFIKDARTNLTGSYTIEYGYGGPKYNPFIFIFTKDTKVDTTTEEAKKAADKSPRTGDASDVWFMMLLISAVGIVELKKYAAKRNER